MNVPLHIPAVIVEPYTWWQHVKEYYSEIIGDPADADHVEVRIQNAWGTQQSGIGAFAHYGTEKYWKGVTIEWEALADSDGAGNGTLVIGGLYLNRRIEASDFHISIEQSMATGTVWLFTKQRGTDSYIVITSAVADWTEKHKFKIHWETDTEYPPNGRVRLWIDGDLKATTEQNIPNMAELHFAVGVYSNLINAMTIPHVKLFSFKEV